MYLDEKIFDEGNVTGFQVGPVVSFFNCLPLSLETAILFSQRGLTVKDNGNTTKTKTNYLDVPVHVKYKVGVSTLKLYLLAGPYVSFRISGDSSINGIYSSVSDQWKARSFAAGGQLGGGVELFSFIQVGANYELGLTDDYRNGKLGAKNRNVSIYSIIYF